MAGCLLISDFTIDGLAAHLRDAEVETAVAPFDQVTQVLLDGGLPCWAARPKAAVVWTRPHSAVPSFQQVLAGASVDPAALDAEVDAHAARIRSAAERVEAMFVPAWTLPCYERGLGVLDLDPVHGHAYRLARMNLRLADALADDPSIFVLDAARWTAAAGPTATNPKLWFLGKIAFGASVFRAAARDIRAGLRAVAGKTRKLLVLDLDDTLWGGIVGDAGWENLKLGGHDPLGESFVAFQKALKALTNRGVVLGIVSKNTESIALEAIDSHPEMVLGRDDFVGWRIDWNDKAQNVADLTAEINIGLDAVVFIDDNPVERGRVREALPDVHVPEWPKDKTQYARALAELDCFDTARISAEDRERTKMYRAEAERKSVQLEAGSLEDYLGSLGLEITCEELDSTNLPRTAQLLNKTNQMNLSTRRMPEAEFAAWAQEPDHRVLVFRVADKFGDYGLTGIASMAVDGERAEVCDFILSCRVMGRGVERAMLSALVEQAREMGAAEIVATHVPTRRNLPCREFFEEKSDFAADQDRFSWSVDDPYAPPVHARIRRTRAV